VSGTPGGAFDLLAQFPAGATPRPAQRRLLTELAEALEVAAGASDVPRVFLVEAPPGVGKSHVAMALARWSGDAYLLTSQKLLQDQYEREFGGQLQLVKGRDNYTCDLYPTPVPTSQGVCRRRRGFVCQCPYARAKAAALAGPVFCTNTAYFATLRHWHREQLARRRLLVVDEAHHLEAQLVHVATAAFSAEQMAAWFGATLPRLPAADDYRPLLEGHVERLEARRATVERALEAESPSAGDADLLRMPPSREEHDLLGQRELLDTALARIRAFLDTEDVEWIVRYPPEADAALELVPLGVPALARDLLVESADVVVLSSAYLGPAAVVADALGLERARTRRFSAPSPFSLAQRPIEYRPVGALSQATLARLEPALFAEVETILAAHADEKGLIHAPSYAAGRRLAHYLSVQAPRLAERLIWIETADAKPQALELHRATVRPTVLLSPSLREGIDLPDDFLRFQIVTKMPYPDLGDPWTAARQARDPRWYAVETAKGLVQAYGRSCRHADDHGVTYILDAQFKRFVTRYRPLLPGWFREAAEPALRAARV
jgi:Rad3-related DNA helicase